ncbi:MAG TPA: hypothetical protein VKN99_14630 [Polyangia bacterium]|nr:hypothetical protein [Polyangia bacterium]
MGSFEYRSRLRIAGLPLVHVTWPRTRKRPLALGSDPDTFPLAPGACGIVAIGPAACGVVAIGWTCAFGVVAISPVLAVGLLAGCGGLAAFGLAALGVLGAGVVWPSGLLWAAPLGIRAAEAAVAWSGVGLWLGLARRERWQKVRRLSARHAMRGRIVPLSTVPAPLYQVPCVFYHARWTELGTRIAECGVDFLVADAGGATVRVEAAGLTSLLEPPPVRGDQTAVGFLAAGDVVTVGGDRDWEPDPWGASAGYRTSPLRGVLKNAVVTNREVAQLRAEVRVWPLLAATYLGAAAGAVALALAS